MNNKNVFYFALGRNAMYAVCKILNLQKDDEVLTPAWDCDGSLEPFRAIGCKIIFYKIDQFSQSISLEHIESLITPKTKLIHIINYFGIPQPWNEILEFRKKIDIPILEDNAYSLPIFLNKDSSNIGTFGDFSIFSIRKTLQLPDGGILKINNGMEYTIDEKVRKWLYKSEFGRIKDFSIAFTKGKLGLSKISISGFFNKNKRLSSYFPSLFDDLETKIPVCDRGGISKEFAYDFERPISKLSNFLFSRYTKSKLINAADKRVNLYKFLNNELSSIKKIKIIKPLLPSGTIPEYFTILVENNRDKILELLQKKRYPVMAWPTLPNEIISRLTEFPEVEYLGKRVIQINLGTKTRYNDFKKFVNDLKFLVGSK